MLMSRLAGIRRLLDNASGVAYVEFAYSLPVLVALGLGGLEATNLAITHMRVNQVAVTTADNAARVRVHMDETHVEEVFAGANVVGRSIDLNNRGRIVMSSIEDNGRPGNGRGQQISWQRCHGGRNTPPAYGRQGQGRSDASLRDGVGAPGRRIAAQPGTAVMFVEVTYGYEPVILRGIIPGHDIRYETAFNVRERTELGITNVRGRPIRSC